ncbi:hypothetical protein ACFFX0_29755 [Citricoccus parietis]|uniref:Uncharacterized protein n=1 Tax=Citricoccus parietis TaxID=592307 RepID=A0ABV5G855_9MICC
MLQPGVDLLAHNAVRGEQAWIELPLHPARALAGQTGVVAKVSFVRSVQVTRTREHLSSTEGEDHQAGAHRQGYQPAQGAVRGEDAENSGEAYGQSCPADQFCGAQASAPLARSRSATPPSPITGTPQGRICAAGPHARPREALVTAGVPSGQALGAQLQHELGPDLSYH